MERKPCAVGGLLLASLHGCESTVTAGGLGVLTTHTNAPVVTETPVKAHPLHALNVLSQSLVQEVGILLGCLAILDVSLPVQHPCWDLELQRLADNCHDLVHFISGEFSSALVQVNVALLANDVGDSSAHTTDCGQCEHHFLAAIHVRVAHTQNVLEVL